jgi:shikimate dehydrogenase
MATPAATLCPPTLEPSTRPAPVTVAGAADFIRGTTLLFPIFGFPAAQVKAPALMNPLFARTGIDAAVVPIEVAPADYPAMLRALLRARNVPGALVTIPHKATTVALLDDCSGAVRIAGLVRRAPRRRLAVRRALFGNVGFVAPPAPRLLRCRHAASSWARAVPAPRSPLARGSRRARDRLHDTGARTRSRSRRNCRSHRAVIDAGTPHSRVSTSSSTPAAGHEAGDRYPSCRLSPAMTVEIVMKQEITPLPPRRGLPHGHRPRDAAGTVPLYLEFSDCRGLTSRGSPRQCHRRRRASVRRQWNHSRETQNSEVHHALPEAPGRRRPDPVRGPRRRRVS